VSECEILKALFCQKQGELSKQYDIITANDANIKVSNLDQLLNADKIDNELNTIASVLKSSFPYSGIDLDFPAAHALFNSARDKACQLSELITQLSSVYETTVFSIDYNGILSRYKTEYTSF